MRLRSGSHATLAPPRPSHAHAPIAAFVGLVLAIGLGSGAAAEPTGPDSSGASPPPPAVAEAAATGNTAAHPTAARIADLGFENVIVDSQRVSFENRRYRHTAEALGFLSGEGGGSMVAFEQRLGLVSAAITNTGTPDQPRFQIRYPSDPDFPAPPRGRRISPTWRSVDVLVGPLLAYELGRTTQPVQFQLQIEPRIRYNPWPGAVATASMVVPVYNDFFPSDLHPDVDRLRLGLLSLQQYAWVPRIALASASAGVFGDNRYGISVGAARPFAQGMILLDAQADLTGFLAFAEEGTLYSSMSESSTFASLTLRPPFLDVAIRGRLARFLYGDEGEELEFKRSMGDVDFALFSFRSNGRYTKGVRISVPVPPMTRSTGSRVRVQPVERFPFSYRTETETVGLYLTGVASREEFLRQLSAPALNANSHRYRKARGGEPADRVQPPVDWVSLSGMTGFINTPWAGVMRDRGIELSASHIPKKWSYDGRGTYANEPWTLTLGVLPRVEVAMRFTRIPGRKGFFDTPENLLNTDTDHMASGRLTLLTAKERRPGLAVGVEDVEGTRRFHSTYAVSGLPIAILHVQSRLSLGYAPRVLTAARHVLDGAFGAFEVSPWRVVAVRVEYDTEKWNAGIGVGLNYGLRFRAAALNMQSVSVGVSWFHEL